jgi:hypothetical protein
MAQAQDPRPAPKAQPPWLDWLVRQRQAASYTLFGLSVVFWIGCVVLALLPHWLEHADTLENFWPAAWAGALGLVTLAAGLWHLLYEPGQADPHDMARVLALALGGLAGLLTTLLGVALAWQWWDDLTSWVRAGEGTGLTHAALALAAFFCGLAIMFLSLQLARTQERSSAMLRRLLYGYNTALMGLLLVAILLVANVLVGTAATKTIDFTSSEIYSLSSRAKNVLQGLKEPTKIYVVMSKARRGYDPVMTLLDNCRAVSDKVEVSVVPPGSPRVEQLTHKYPDLLSEGLVIVYGSEDNAPHVIINSGELGTEPELDRSNAERKESYIFKGEDALITQLDFLESGKQKAVVYFTQGDGELDLDNRQTQGANQGIGLFRDQLEKRNYQVKPLRFSPGENKVPDDAALVVIARPRDAWSRDALKALRDYMSPADPKKAKGRLLILFGLEPDRAGHVMPTGLEAFVSKYNVHVTDERILSIQDNPLQVVVRTNPDLEGQNPVATAFGRSALVLTGARLVEPSTNRAPGSAYDAQALFLAIPSQGIWAEGDLNADATQLSEKMRQDRELLLRKISRRALPVAVAVTETKPSNPHGFMQPQSADSESKPRLVVFGDASIVTNRYMAVGRGQTGVFEVIASCMDWLRERPQSIGIDPKKRDFYALNPEAETLRMVLLPGVLMMFGVVGLGAGIWVVRRR